MTVSQSIAAWIYALAAGGLAFMLSALAGKPFVAFLHRRGLRKHIRAEGPQAHAVKEGTPTMGGLLIFATVFAVTVPTNLVGRLSMALPLSAIVSCGLLGLVDDLMEVRGQARSGLRARIKMASLVVIAIVAAVGLHFGLGLRSVYIPLVGKFDIGLWHLPIAVTSIVGFANAVNLTDGLDTLAGSTSATAFGAYGIIAFLQEQAYLVTFCLTVAGAVLGFLWYNAHPAQVFMGDTGSLALGATLAVVAFMTGHWLLLPVVGMVFVLEAASVILQVAYFKLSGGKRIFRMAPLHHHFELSGWAETQVAMRFWLIAVGSGMLGITMALV